MWSLLVFIANLASLILGLIIVNWAIDQGKATRGVTLVFVGGTLMTLGGFVHAAFSIATYMQHRG